MDLKAKFATLRLMKSPIKQILLDALEHVKHFIIKRKLILVGGMAIDCNLRLKNLKLYDDDQIPDYDFLSPENAEDGYLLGHELCTKGFPNVDVITAIHTTTMKVRVDGNVVADITYVPRELFDKIDTLEFKGMRIIHPWYTMMDQFRSFSCPYENPPNEVISDRWNKDVERFNMLYGAYGFPQKAVDEKKLTLHQVDIQEFPNSAHSGWVALIYYLDQANIDHNFSIKGKKASLPVPNTVFVTTDIIPFSTKKNTKLFNPIVSYPRRVELPNGTQIYDVWGERTTLNTNDKKYVSLATLTYYFWHKFLWLKDPLASLALSYIEQILLKTPLTLDVVPLGTQSWNMSTLYSIAALKNYERVRDWKPQIQNFPSGDCGIKRHFDPSKSPLFAIDGSQCNKFEALVESGDLKL